MLRRARWPTLSSRSDKKMLGCNSSRRRLVRFAIKFPRFSADCSTAPSCIHRMASPREVGRGRFGYSRLHFMSQSWPAAPLFFRRLFPFTLVPLAVFRYVAVEEITLWLQTFAMSSKDQPRDRKWLQQPVRPPRRAKRLACSCEKP